MNVLLAVIAVLGLITLILSVYIFAIAARSFVSGDHPEPTDRLHTRALVPRDRTDRRKASPAVLFPIVINGVVIPVDRRKGLDRRKRPLLQQDSLFPRNNSAE